MFWGLLYWKLSSVFESGKRLLELLGRNRLQSEVYHIQPLEIVAKFIVGSVDYNWLLAADTFQHIKAIAIGQACISDY